MKIRETESKAKNPYFDCKLFLSFPSNGMLYKFLPDEVLESKTMRAPLLVIRYLAFEKIIVLSTPRFPYPPNI